MGSNENQANSNGVSSSTINSTSTSTISFSILSSLVFITPIKHTNNNYLLWQSQAIAIINANELEDLIDNTKSPPNRVVIYVDNDQTVVNHQIHNFISGERMINNCCAGYFQL